MKPPDPPARVGPENPMPPDAPNLGSVEDGRSPAVCFSPTEKPPGRGQSPGSRANLLVGDVGMREAKARRAARERGRGAETSEAVRVLTEDLLADYPPEVRGKASTRLEARNRARCQVVLDGLLDRLERGERVSDGSIEVAGKMAARLKTAPAEEKAQLQAKRIPSSVQEWLDQMDAEDRAASLAKGVCPDCEQPLTSPPSPVDCSASHVDGATVAEPVPVAVREVESVVVVGARMPLRPPGRGDLPMAPAPVQPVAGPPPLSPPETKPGRSAWEIQRAAQLRQVDKFHGTF